MARVSCKTAGRRCGKTLKVEWKGMDLCHASMRSVAEAWSAAHIDLEFDIKGNGDGLYFEGMRIAAVSASLLADVALFTIKPNASILLFAGWVMTQLPGTATLRWADGWPMFHCPPRDDRDAEDDPMSFGPTLLEPVE